MATAWAISTAPTFTSTPIRGGVHPEWHSFLFNYGRNEVRAFLLSSALFWLDMYHIDGLRVDAVASMLYLDYARANGQWLPNRFGGRGEPGSGPILRTLNERVYANHPDTITIAEESTAWPMVSRPVYVGGLGFGYKWDMGWMHDTLEYMRQDPLFRRYHHDKLTFRMMYAFSENFVLPLSHDEVVLWQRLPAGRDARRCVAEVRQSAAAVGRHVRPTRKEAALHGREFGPVERVEPRQRPRHPHFLIPSRTPACNGGWTT